MISTQISANGLQTAPRLTATRGSDHIARTAMTMLVPVLGVALRDAQTNTIATVLTIAANLSTSPLADVAVGSHRLMLVLAAIGLRARLRT